MSIRYVVLPMLDDENDDNIYLHFLKPGLPRTASLTGANKKAMVLENSRKTYDAYYALLQATPYLKELPLGTTGVKLFVNTGYLSLIHADKADTQYTFVSPTQYHLSLHIPANTTGFSLRFLQTFHP